MLSTACSFVVGLGLGLGLDLASGWLVFMHTHLYYFLLSLSTLPEFIIDLNEIHEIEINRR